MVCFGVDSELEKMEIISVEGSWLKQGHRWSFQRLQCSVSNFNTPAWVEGKLPSGVVKLSTCSPRAALWGVYSGEKTARRSSDRWIVLELTWRNQDLDRRWWVIKAVQTGVLGGAVSDPSDRSESDVLTFWVLHDGRKLGDGPIWSFCPGICAGRAGSCHRRFGCSAWSELDQPRRSSKYVPSVQLRLPAQLVVLDVWDRASAVEGAECDKGTEEQHHPWVV